MYKLFLFLLFVCSQVSGLLDTEEHITNNQTMQELIACLLGTGPCTKEQDEYRLSIPEIVKTSCGKCDPGTKDFFVKTTKFVVQNHPDQWKKLIGKYDPQGKYEDGLLRLVGLKS